MDEILAVNCVITECGHVFHTSCLMQNAAHNGFGCPYCRAVLADVPAEEEDDDDVSEDLTYDEERYDDHALRGMRWMFRQNSNEPLNNEEDQEEDDEDDEEENQVEEQVPKPSAAFISAKLVEQGITMVDLVKSLLSINHEEYEDFEDYEQKENELFGKFRILISNYQPQTQVAEQTPVVQTPVVQTPVVQLEQPTTQTQADDSAQPKERATSSRRRSMYNTYNSHS